MRRETTRHGHRVPRYQLAFAGDINASFFFLLLMYKLSYSARVQPLYFRGGYFDAYQQLRGEITPK